MLVIRDVFKRVGDRDVLRGASLRHGDATIVWLRGPNGCGKSTLLRCVTGVWRPDRGEILVCGRSTIDEGHARREVGYVPDQLAPFPELTVHEMLALVAALKRSPWPPDELVEQLGVSRFDHQSVASLSAGQTRRAALLAGLIGDPWLLALDEPTTGLDDEGVARLRDILHSRRARGKSALLVTHDRRFAEALEAIAYDVRDGVLVAAP